MIEYIPISKSLSNIVSNHLINENNSGISTRADSGIVCDVNCSSSCAGTCVGDCKGTCTGHCSGGCKGGCKGECTGSCQTSCEDTCSNACQTRCENGGQTVSSYNKTFPFYWNSEIEEDKTILITAKEWNDFAKKIINNASYCGKSSPNIELVEQNKPITASAFNSLKNGVNRLNQTNINDKIANQSLIEAKDFLTLASKMNSATVSNIECCELGEYCVQHCNQSSGKQVGS